MSGLVVRPFMVSVSGFPDGLYVARSHGKALARAWDDYRAYEDCSFGDFMRKARVRKGTACLRFGEPITVGGRPAFYVSQRGQYVQFVEPGSDVVLNSHPLDVQRQAAISTFRGSGHE